MAYGPFGVPSHCLSQWFFIRTHGNEHHSKLIVIILGCFDFTSLGSVHCTTMPWNEIGSVTRVCDPGYQWNIGINCMKLVPILFMNCSECGLVCCLIKWFSVWIDSMASQVAPDLVGLDPRHAEPLSWCLLTSWQCDVSPTSARWSLLSGWILNSSDAEDVIFRLIGLMSCLLMP